MPGFPVPHHLLEFAKADTNTPSKINLSIYRTKFGLGVQNEAGERLTEYCKENVLVIANTLSQQHKRRPKHGCHEPVNTKIRLIIFFAAEDGEALYS